MDKLEGPRMVSSNHRWTDAERQWLRDNYGTVSSGLLAKRSGFSVSQITGMAYKLGLKSNRKTGK